MIEFGEAAPFSHGQTFLPQTEYVRHPWGTPRGRRGLRGKYVCRHCLTPVHHRALGRHIKSGTCGNKSRILAQLRAKGIRTESYSVEFLRPAGETHRCPACDRRMYAASWPKAMDACHRCGVEYRWSDLRDSAPLSRGGPVTRMPADWSGADA